MWAVVIITVQLTVIAGLLLLLANIGYGVLLELRALNEEFDTAATRDRWRTVVARVNPGEWHKSAGR